MTEYYDELYPITDSQKAFYLNLKNKYQSPAKFLQIGSATGRLENFLVESGADATGIEVSKELISISLIRNKSKNTPLRFFRLSIIDMLQFLSEGFYDVISCLNSRVIFIHSEERFQKFFCDAKKLLAANGMLVLNLYNFSLVKDIGINKLPPRESERVKLNSTVTKTEDGKMFLNQKIETSSKKILPIMENEELYPVTIEHIYKFAKEAGFSNINLYSSYSMEEFTNDSNQIICTIK